MKEVLVVVCHNEASISFRIGLQLKLLDLKAKICSEWIQFSPMSIQIFHKYGEQQKVVEFDLDLQYLANYALYNKFTTLDLHVSSSVVLQQRVRAGSSSSAVVQQRVHAGSSSSAVVPYGHPEVTRVTDYDMPNKVARSFLLDAPVDKWASMYFPGCRYGELCSNVAECFNGWIREEREMPIAVMADEIRKRLIKQRCEHREVCATSFKWRSTLCQEREIGLQNNKMHGREYPVIKSSEFVYEVQSSITQSVDLKKRTCSCNRWRIDGFPCAHDVRCIMASGEDPYKYVEPYFTTKFYQGSYALPIKTVPNSERPSKVSPKSCVLAPDAMPQQPGRPPKRKRIPNTGSIPNKKMRQCGKCKLLTTHNRRTCNAEQ